MNSVRLENLFELLKENPEDPFLHYGIAMEYIDETPEKSVEILQKLIKDHPDYLASYYTLGNLLYEEEEYENALDITKKGIQLASNKGDQKAEKELKQLKVNIEFSL